MKKNEITNTHKIFIILGISLLGMAIGILITKITGQSFMFGANDRFMDYFNTLRVSNEVYNGIGPGRGYFPFTYVLLNIIKYIIPHEFTSYVTISIFVVIGIIYFCNYLFENLDFLGMLLISFLTYPLIFSFDRGNIENIALVFLLFFVICYRKKKYKQAAILLAFPICMKLYPAVFIILFLKDKKYKEFFLCGIFTVILMIGSFIAIGGNITNLPIAIDNLEYFTDTYAKARAGIQYSHTIWSGLNYLSMVLNNGLLPSSSITLYTILIAVLALGLVAYIIFIEKQGWKAITILTIMMITFPHVSFDYTLIHMLIPIACFALSEKNKKWEEIVYSVLLAGTILPMNWFQNTELGIVGNWGLLIRPLILVTIILLIVITTLYNNKNIKKECVKNG